MKNKKTLFLTMLLAIVMVFGMVGCGGAEPVEEESQEPVSTFDATTDITVVSREEGSGTRGAFIELMGVEVKDEAGNKKDMTTEEAVIANKTDIVLTSVAGDPYAVGYISLGSLNDTVKALNIEGVEVSAENIKNGTYTVARPFNIATKGTPNELTQDFISFIMSAEGQEIVSKSYIAVDEQAAAYAGTMPAGKLVVAGSSSVSPLMEKLIEAYMAVNAGANIELQTSDSTSGMTGAIDGTCDIGMASRGLKEGELAELTPLVIAMDGIAVIVNNENPTADMNKDQVKSIFIGETTTWDSL